MSFGGMSPEEQVLLMISQMQREANAPRGNGLLPANAFDGLKSQGGASMPTPGGNPLLPPAMTRRPFGSLAPGGQQVAGSPAPYLGGPGAISNQSGFNGPEAWTGRMPQQPAPPVPQAPSGASSGPKFNLRDFLKMGLLGGDGSGNPGVPSAGGAAGYGPDFGLDALS